MRSILTLLLLAILCVPAQAAFEGPGSAVTASTVQQALKAADNTPMCLEGNVVDKIVTSKEKYNFKDATGTMVAEIDDKVIATVNFTPATRVRICGKVDTEFTRPTEFEVKNIQIIQ